MDRQESLQRFVRQCFPDRDPAIAPASSDASFRRYFRLGGADGGATHIVMDAPPDKEDCRPFVHVAGLLADCGVNVPRVLKADLDHGFLLLSDLGRLTYLEAMNADAGAADALYRDAIAALVRMQAADASTLPPYDRARLLREMELLPEWYIGRHHGFTMTPRQTGDLSKTFDALIANNLAQPQVFVHRDYHSRNLMVCSPESGTGPNPGILDFQDAVRGPVTYDLVSLFKDAYIEWEEERILEWVIRYWEAARAARLPVQADFGEFYRDFDWMGLQRHLKILGIFARLYHRDGKSQYLADLPLVLRHARKTCERYMAFTPLLRLFDAIEKVEQRGGYTF